MRPLLVLLLFIAMFHSGAAQQQASTTKPTPTATTTPEKRLSPEKQIRKTVTFIRMLCARDGQAYEARGTGFWVSYPDERLKDRQFTYLITNRHVAECWDGDTHQPMPVHAVWFKVGQKDGGASEIPMAQGGNLNWIVPSDRSVDLAVLPGAPADAKWDYLQIPTSYFLDNQEISEGDKILFSGFFYQLKGLNRMEPIIREGILAMMPDEDITTTTGEPGRVYLGDVHIFGGNSGSPVFVDTGGVHGDSFTVPGQYRLLGVVSGMFYEDTDLSLQVTTSIKGTAHGNSGIAMIVPVKYLKELLDDPRLKAARDAEVARLRKEGKPSAN